MLGDWNLSGLGWTSENNKSCAGCAALDLVGFGN